MNTNFLIAFCCFLSLLSLTSSQPDFPYDPFWALNTTDYGGISPSLAVRNVFRPSPIVLESFSNFVSSPQNDYYFLGMKHPRFHPNQQRTGAGLYKIRLSDYYNNETRTSYNRSIEYLEKSLPVSLFPGPLYRTRFPMVEEKTRQGIWFFLENSAILNNNYFNFPQGGQGKERFLVYYSYLYQNSTYYAIPFEDSILEFHYSPVRNCFYWITQKIPWWKRLPSSDDLINKIPIELKQSPLSKIRSFSSSSLCNSSNPYYESLGFFPIASNESFFFVDSLLSSKTENFIFLQTSTSFYQYSILEKIFQAFPNPIGIIERFSLFPTGNPLIVGGIQFSNNLIGLAKIPDRLWFFNSSDLSLSFIPFNTSSLAYCSLSNLNQYSLVSRVYLECDSYNGLQIRSFVLPPLDSSAIINYSPSIAINYTFPKNTAIYGFSVNLIPLSLEDQRNSQGIYEFLGIVNGRMYGLLGLIKKTIENPLIPITEDPSVYQGDPSKQAILSTDNSINSTFLLLFPYRGDVYNGDEKYLNNIILPCNNRSILLILAIDELYEYSLINNQTRVLCRWYEYFPRIGISVQTAIEIQGCLYLGLTSYPTEYFVKYCLANEQLTILSTRYSFSKLNRILLGNEIFIQGKKFLYHVKNQTFQDSQDFSFILFPSLIQITNKTMTSGGNFYSTIGNQLVEYRLYPFLISTPIQILYNGPPGSTGTYLVQLGCSSSSLLIFKGVYQFPNGDIKIFYISYRPDTQLYQIYNLTNSRTNFLDCSIIGSSLFFMLENRTGTGPSETINHSIWKFSLLPGSVSPNGTFPIEQSSMEFVLDVSSSKRIEEADLNYISDSIKFNRMIDSIDYSGIFISLICYGVPLFVFIRIDQLDSGKLQPGIGTLGSSCPALPRSPTLYFPSQPPALYLPKPVNLQCPTVDSLFLPLLFSSSSSSTGSAFSSSSPASSASSRSSSSSSSVLLSSSGSSRFSTSTSSPGISTSETFPGSSSSSSSSLQLSISESSSSSEALKVSSSFLASSFSSSSASGEFSPSPAPVSSSDSIELFSPSSSLSSLLISGAILLVSLILLIVLSFLLYRRFRSSSARLKKFRTSQFEEEIMMNPMNRA